MVEASGQRLGASSGRLDLGAGTRGPCDSGGRRSRRAQDRSVGPRRTQRAAAKPPNTWLARNKIGTALLHLAFRLLQIYNRATNKSGVTSQREIVLPESSKSVRHRGQLFLHLGTRARRSLTYRIDIGMAR